MTPRRPRSAVAALTFALTLLALSLAGAFGLAAPAAAQSVPVTGVSCAPGEGVTVVVDFQGLPGGVKVGCAPGVQANGLAALAAAGFSVGMDGNASIVCTVDGVPVQGYPYCWSGGGYWSYWKAVRGGSWGYSPAGAGSGPLAIDSVEGWSWAADFVSQAPRANETSVPPRTTTTTTVPTTTAPGSTTIPASSTTTASTNPSTPTTTPPASSPGTVDAGSTVPSGPSGTAPSVDTSAPGGSVQGVSTGSSGSGAGPTTSLARTGSDPTAPAVVGTVLLVAGAVAVVTGRRLASRR